MCNRRCRKNENAEKPWHDHDKTHGDLVRIRAVAGRGARIGGVYVVSDAACGMVADELLPHVNRVTTSAYGHAKD
jgi:hypothetical protein